MSYMKIANINIRENGRKVNLFHKVEEIKKRIRQIYPELDDIRIRKILSACRQYYEGKLVKGRRGTAHTTPREPTEIEKGIYTLLIQMGLNPSTTYRWFLACRYPSDIKDKIEKGQISHRLAQKLSANRYRETKSRESYLLLDEIRQAVRRL